MDPILAIANDICGEGPDSAVHMGMYPVIPRSMWGNN